MVYDFGYFFRDAIEGVIRNHSEQEIAAVSQNHCAKQRENFSFCSTDDAYLPSANWMADSSENERVLKIWQENVRQTYTAHTHASRKWNKTNVELSSPFQLPFVLVFSPPRLLLLHSLFHRPRIFLLFEMWKCSLLNKTIPAIPLCSGCQHHHRHTNQPYSQWAE